LDARPVADWIAKLDCGDLCRRAITAEVTTEHGAAPENISYLALLAQVKGGGMERYWTDSESYRLAGGSVTLVNRLVEAIGRERVLTGNPVAAIESAAGRVVITCADGRRYEADDVVLAVPPSTWSRIAIEPALPTILRPQMGVNVKYLAGVSTRFWLPDKISADSQGDGPVGSTWEASGAHRGGTGAVLAAFSGGPAADECRRQPKAERDAFYRRELEVVYPTFGQHVVATRFMDWPADRWTKAGYSCAAPGEVTAIGPKLRSGIGRLHFAGEHCCYQFAGYMEGALHSGVSLARRIAQRDGQVET
jgi:monoamine oxidase